MRIDGFQTYQQLASALDRNLQTSKSGQGDNMAPGKAPQAAKDPPQNGGPSETERLLVKTPAPGELPESVTFMIARGNDSLEISEAGRKLIEEQMKNRSDPAAAPEPGKQAAAQKGQMPEPDLVHQVDLLA